MIRDSINALKKKFKDYQIDGYIIPKNDNYFSEYASNDRLKKITKFSGSAGLLVYSKKNKLSICRWKIYYSSSTRVIKNFKIIEIHKKFPNKIIKNLNLGYDPKVIYIKNLKNYFSNNNLIPINNNLIDQIFKFKEKKLNHFIL